MLRNCMARNWLSRCNSQDYAKHAKAIRGPLVCWSKLLVGYETHTHTHTHTHTLSVSLSLHCLYRRYCSYLYRSSFPSSSLHGWLIKSTKTCPMNWISSKRPKTASVLRVTLHPTRTSRSLTSIGYVHTSRKHLQLPTSIPLVSCANASMPGALT
jgi:hypothetical protein